jgi:hypothetical protein
MSLVYKIVLIDDDATVRSDIYGLGNSIGFEVFAYDNLEDGMEKLRQDTSINGLVLDAECKVTSESKESLNFLAQAANMVEELKRSRDRDIFVLINTAFSSDVIKFFGDSYPINKKDEPKKLFEVLQEGIDALERTYVSRKYSESIEKLNKVVGDSSKEDILVRLLKNLNREDPETIESNLSDIRKIYEAIIRILTEQVDIPSNMSARSIILFLAGRECKDLSRRVHQIDGAIIPPYISDICFAVWGLGSSGGHDNEDEIHCTKNTAIGTTHLLLDLINWVSKWMDDQ